MSHGAAGESDVKAEPNLVPLLDVVMQLLMFFLICVNFSNAAFNESIDLPVSQTARPVEFGEDDMLVLNLNQYGHLEVPGESQPRDTPAKINYYIKQQYQDAKRVAEAGGRDKVKTLVILRADGRADYEQVYRVMRQCKNVGYTRLQLRAKRSG
jgi:biopolymer transport protein ExbD